MAKSCVVLALEVSMSSNERIDFTKGYLLTILSTVFLNPFLLSFSAGSDSIIIFLSNYLMRLNNA